MELNSTYTKCGDYYIPDIKSMHRGTQTLGKYGRMRRVFLEQSNPILFNDMVLTETLFPHLWEIQRSCENRMDILMADLLEKNPAPDKETQQFAWAAHMNSLKAQAEEMVVTELIIVILILSFLPIFTERTAKGLEILGEHKKRPDMA